MAEQTSIAAIEDLRGVIRIARVASNGVNANGPRIDRAEQAISTVAGLVRQLEFARDFIFACSATHGIECVATLAKIDEALAAARRGAN